MSPSVALSKTESSVSHFGTILVNKGHTQLHCSPFYDVPHSLTRQKYIGFRILKYHGQIKTAKLPIVSNRDLKTVEISMIVLTSGRSAASISTQLVIRPSKPVLSRHLGVICFYPFSKVLTGTFAG